MEPDQLALSRFHAVFKKTYPSSAIKGLTYTMLYHSVEVLSNIIVHIEKKPTEQWV